MTVSARTRAWTALLLPPVVWYVHQQGIGGPLHVNCHVAAGGTALVWGVASLIVCIAAAWVAWPLARRSQAHDGPVACWIARLAMLGAAVFALAIVIGSLASALVPPCAR